MLMLIYGSSVLYLLLYLSGHGTLVFLSHEIACFLVNW